jgi:hypothetical protein
MARRTGSKFQEASFFRQIFSRIWSSLLSNTPIEGESAARRAFDAPLMYGRRGQIGFC